MASSSNPLDRLREQRATKLLTALQDDLRSQMRLESDEFGRNRATATASLRRKARISRLADPQERERIWGREQLPSYEGEAIRSLPKSREFWRQVDVSTWCKAELDAACMLLDLPTEGKKLELIERIQHWVHEPEIIERREQQRLLELQKDAILASGRVFAFGCNASGELGLGHRRACEVPTEIESFRGAHVTHVYSGFDANFAFARCEDGRIYGWGGGGHAVFDDAALKAGRQKLPQLEETTESDVNLKRGDSSSRFLLPRLLPCLSDLGLKHISCGQSSGHIAVTSSNGECFTWGRGDYGELGTGTCELGGKATTEDPIRVESLAKSHIVVASVGNTHTAAITEKGRLYTWGSCWSGQLGLGEARRAGVKDRHLQLCFPSPTVVEALQSKRITRVSCGAVHTAVVSVDGQLFTFGCGDGGRLGLGSNDNLYHPQLVTALDQLFVLDVCCGSWHSLCIASERDESMTRAPRRLSGAAPATESDRAGGFVFTFGSGLQGQLGLGKQKLAAVPTCLPTLRRRQVRCLAIATSSHHSCALGVDGNLYTWGQNASGRLGRTGSEVGAVDIPEPGVVDRGSFRDYGVGPIVSIAAGHCFTLFATGPWEPHEEPLKTHFHVQTKVNRHSTTS